MKETTIEILKEAGWYPNRKIDISILIESYEKRGFEMFSSAKDFLEEYGMLDVYTPVDPKHIDKELVQYGYGKFKLNSTRVDNYIVRGSISREYVAEYEEEYVEEKLVVVGSLAGHQYLMISESGKLFTEYGFFGNNAEEFWDRILNYGIVTEWSQWEDF